MATAVTATSSRTGSLRTPKHPRRRLEASEETSSKPNLRRLAIPSDRVCLPAINYAYNPLPLLPLRHGQTTRRLPRHASVINRYAALNSISLDPFGANLPYRSSIDHVRASKFWKPNLGETTEFLTLLASDDSAADVEVDQGIALARLAKKCLQPGYEDQIVLAMHYMFPAADEERVRQMACLMIIYFVFDDKVEETPDDKLQLFRDDFLYRLEGQHVHGKCKTSKLQKHTDDIILGIEVQDARDGGNGGREMLNALREAWQCVHPPKEGFKSVDEYLRFRRLNMGAAFVIAAAKYSIHSRIDHRSPKYSRFLNLVSDHLGIVNDLASYDKELRALAEGKTNDMINLRHVIRTVTLSGQNGEEMRGISKDEAKGIAWALQLETERQMMEELERFRTSDDDGGLTDEEWWLLEAVVATCTGNVFFCMSTSRYGGEAARI